MSIVLHWFLPTAGDSRINVGLGGATGVTGIRADEDRGERAPDLAYLAQIARAAERNGFAGALTPASSWCEDAWVVASALAPLTETFRFLVAFRPGLIAPTLAAQMAATFQRVSGGRLLLNVVVGGEDAEQARFGDFLPKDERYARADEFLSLVRPVWDGAPTDFDGRHSAARGAQVVPATPWPRIYLGGSSSEAMGVAARHADVFLTWGEYHEIGIDEFILSGYPHLEEVYRAGEGLVPALARRGLVAPAGGEVRAPA